MQKNTVSPIIEAFELKASGSKSFVIIDAGSGNEAFERYKKKHIVGAIYVDLNTDLSLKPVNVANGGRHPLPDILLFAEVLGRLGITPDTSVLVYDDKSGSNAAARFWWMMKSVGHKDIRVLNGGLRSAIKAGINTSSIYSPPIKAEPYPVEKWILPTVNISEVKKATYDNSKIIIDVRDPARFNGQIEPIDPVAGCIDNAINMPFKENLDEDGMFLSPYNLKKKYLPLFEKFNAGNIIIHCGSGVTACHTLLAIEHAGLPIPNLYVGSWSEWCHNYYPDNLL